jgi:DNA-binding XRE family transcriptional regulator
MNPATFSSVMENHLRERGTSRLSAEGMARTLDLQQQELAHLAGVHRNTLRMHPESPKVQDTLRGLSRLLSAANEVQPDLDRAVFLIKNEPIAAFGHKTLMQLVQAGRTDDAIAYLESIGSGYVG